MTALVGPAAALEISSPAVGADNTIPAKYTANSFGCSGENVSLPLVWEGVPAEAKSLALTMYDPDAPTGSGFWLWLVVNMPPSTTELPEGAGEVGNAGLPARSVQARGDAGVAGHFGPCPPEGDTPHRYIFTIFAVGADPSYAAATMTCAWIFPATAPLPWRLAIASAARSVAS